MHQLDVRHARGSTAPSTLSPHEAKQSLWFAEEVLPHEPALRTWLRYRFPSLSEGDDIIQESYIRLIRAQEAHEVANVKAYLFMIARNVAMDFFRRNQATPIVSSTDYERSVVMEERTGVAESVCTSQEFEILKEAIDALPDRCRQIMVLQKLQGMASQEIARRLGLSLNTVNAQLVIGLSRCRQYLLARGVLRGRHP